ncbi:hypothetical protein [Pseudoroseicyclus sp. CXY001]|uniref:hypothetical protein n=1 Tax=Pseudoroseicyclus sp. CXY001 TaxID=3242492 RepID=UPI00358DA4D7
MTRKDKTEASLAGQDPQDVITGLRHISDEADDSLTEGEIRTLTEFYTALPPIDPAGEAR